MPRELNGSCDSEGVIEGFDLVVMWRVGVDWERVDEAVRGGEGGGRSDGLRLVLTVSCS